MPIYLPGPSCYGMTAGGAVDTKRLQGLRIRRGYFVLGDGLCISKWRLVNIQNSAVNQVCDEEIRAILV